VNTPRYSVVIPVHNKGPHVARAVRSVLRQTVNAFELLVIDDACTDESMHNVADFDDARLRVLRRESPGPGGYAARNLGVAEAGTDWVAFLDADDEWHPDFLRTVEAVRAEHADAAMIGTGWTIKEPGGALLADAYRRRYPSRGRHAYGLDAYLRDAARLAIPAWTSALAVRRTTLVDAGGFPEEPRFTRGGDHDTWLRVMVHGRRGAWDPLAGATYHRDAQNRVIRKNCPHLGDVPLLHTLRALINEEADPTARALLARYRKAVKRQAVRDNLEFRTVALGTVLLGEARCNALLERHFARKARRLKGAHRG
jgi:glycosyltransferase involved in cell wall biosynthesis